MAHSFSLLIDLAIALFAAFVGGYIARRLRLPTMIGYLLGGVAIGPFTPGYVGNLETLQQMAELGIIFLMFDVGLHFSLNDLWAVRRIAVPGALLQIIVLTLIVVLLAPLIGWPWLVAILMGLALSIASTVVLARNLMDQGFLNTSHGRVAMGWLVLEDLITVILLVLLPAFSTASAEPLWQTVGLALLKVVIFGGGMLLVGTRLIPWGLTRLAFMQSRELFVIAVVLLTVGTALIASAFFGVSLALGAFLAGVVINESSLSHQVNAEILPFRDLFTVLFFVSVGMLVNPLHLWQAAGMVLLLVVLIVPGKFLLTALLTGMLARSTQTALILAAGRSQIGEFSFLLASQAVTLGLLAQEQYSLLLAAAILSILLNPLLFRTLPSLERIVRQMPILSAFLKERQQVPAIPPERLRDHVVVVGYGRVGQHIVHVLGSLGLPRLVVELDLHRVEELDRQGIPTLYGDAANSEILAHAHIEQARAVVVTVPDDASAQIIVATVRRTAHTVPLVARAATQAGVQELLTLGASDVIHPELEGGLNIVLQTLLHLGCATNEIQRYIDAVRRDHYDLSTSTAEEQQALDQLRLSLSFRCRANKKAGPPVMD
ncbi:MAG: cation:proton antiporter [Ktedonobacteraceae bacterium]|nr:cation:proton antiporter [Ktedonobacteraceae bacterium]